ncbi:MAG: hypothetical protein ACR2OZ_12320 [Verrucomicrobiales bacterium]
MREARVYLAYAMVLAGGACFLAVTGCGLFKKNALKEDRLLAEILEGRRAFGEITLINESAGFVVVRTSLGRVISDESLLLVKNGGVTTAKLSSSPEKKRGYLSADIREGTPQIGERVFLPPKKDVNAANLETTQTAEARYSTLARSAVDPAPLDTSPTPLPSALKVRGP